MKQLDTSEVLQLSPDDASTKAAKGLVIPGKWPRLEYDDQAIWGECQGSGAKPYQVQVDRSGPAFRCTCPSRKFPCKHGLALLLLLAQNPDRFNQAAPPAWVEEWLASRRQRAEKQETKAVAAAERNEPAADPLAAARRETARRQRMAAGLAELERWLNDRLRQGLAQLPGQPGAWQELATRMVDAQLPGLAFRLRRIAGRVGRGEDWPGPVLGEMGRQRLLIEAFRRLDTLAPEIRQDVLQALGMSVDRDAVLTGGERLSDDWLVLGQSIDEQERLWQRRVWLLGRQSGRYAMLLDHAHGTRRFEPLYVTGATLHAGLAFFPGNAPLRALPADAAEPMSGSTPPSLSLDAALDALSRRVAGNPWQWPQPLLIGDGIPCAEPSGWSLRTAGGHSLRLSLRDQDGWELLAESGGMPLTLFGEWDSETLRPLSAWNTELIWTEAMDPT